MNRAVAIVAEVDGYLHLSSSEFLFEPFVLVAGARNEMVFVRTSFGIPSTQFTWLCHRWLSSRRIVYCSVAFSFLYKTGVSQPRFATKRPKVGRRE